MPLTPLDVETLKLRTGLRGYDRAEVDSFHREVVGTLEEYVDQIARLKLRVRELETELARFREQEDGMRSSLLLAQRTADELVSAARERAAALLEQAKAEAGLVRRSVADVTAQREQFEYQFHGLLSGFMRRLEQANPELAAVPAPNGRAVSPAGPVLSTMDAQEQPQAEQDLDIDMQDLTVRPVDRVEPDSGDDAVILPMAAPRSTRAADAQRSDNDRDAFNAALESAAASPGLLAQAQLPVSGSDAHGQAEQAALDVPSVPQNLQQIANDRLRAEDDPGQPEVIDYP